MELESQFATSEQLKWFGAQIDKLTCHIGAMYIYSSHSRKSCIPNIYEVLAQLSSLTHELNLAASTCRPPTIDRAIYASFAQCPELDEKCKQLLAEIAGRI